jgi:hypothetical protein
MTSYTSEAAAIQSLEANGFKFNGNSWAKRSMTGGNLWGAPRRTTALCKIIRNTVDPKWASEGYDVSDFFTIRFL